MADDHEDYDEKPAVSKKMRLGILIGLGTVALLVILLVIGVYFSRNGFALSASVATPTPLVARSMPTRFILPTSTPTLTATPVPYEQLIPDGWIQFQTKLVEIWVPSRFKSMDIKKFTSDIEAQNEKIGLGAGESQGIIDLVLLDDTERQSLTAVAVYISFTPLANGSLDDYVDAHNANRSEVYRTVERSKVRVGDYDAIRELIELSYQAKQIDIVAYAIQIGDTVWNVEYTCHILDFYDQLPDFEKSVQTFRPIQ